MALYHNDLIKTLQIIVIGQLGMYENISSNTTNETKTVY